MPLLALRAFVEVGRQGSVKAAAATLGVTPGAVSQQLKLLEQRLCVSLFVRGNREIHLTRVGKSLLAPMSAGFEQIETALESFNLRRRQRAARLRISTVASFAATWLVPRLGRFTGHHPWIELSLHTSPDLIPIGNGENAADVAIRHGLGDYPGFAVERLLQPRLIPIGSPELLKAYDIQSPADCLQLPLLQDADGMDWSLWLRALGVRDPDGLALRGPRLGDDHLLVRAAVASQGLALVRDTYAASEMAAGRLVAALDVPQSTDFAYWLVTRPVSLKQDPAVIAFRRWILGEVQDDQDGG